MTESFAHVALRAAVTFVEVVLSTMVGTNVFNWGVSGWQTAAVAGVGAALSVLYNWVQMYRARLDREAAIAAHPAADLRVVDE